ncbi:MAG: histidine phosphatase family protein [Pseudomonadota bacterium]
MAEIVLVRHGQANSYATDEASYDQLSDLGQQQATWLGTHLRDTTEHFDRVLTGTLKRQIDTARAMGFDNPTEDTRLNELAYFELTEAARRQHDMAVPDSPAGFARYLPRVIELWTQDGLDDVPERFGDFADRVQSIIDEQCRSAGRTLFVTSGGVIGMAVRHSLNLDTSGLAKVMLQITNASIHRLHYVHENLMLGGFNATPHLDGPERSHARTYV